MPFCSATLPISSWTSCSIAVHVRSRADQSARTGPAAQPAAALCHQAESAVPDGLIERELAGDDVVNVPAERVVVPLRDLHGPEHLVLAQLVRLHLLEGFAGVFYSAEVFVYP